MATLQQVATRMVEEKQRPLKKVEEPELLQTWQAFRDRAEGGIQDLLRRQAAVERNGHLSQDGRAAALRELANAALKELAWIGERVGRTHDAQARLRARCLDFMVRGKGDFLVQYLREKEVRDELRTAQQHERDVVALQAAEAGNGEVLRAIQDGPRGPWLRGDVLRRVEEVYGQRRDPEAWRMLEALSVLEERVKGIAQHVAQALLSLGADLDATKKALGLEEAAHG